MSCITRQHVGKYIYLYESTSYWDKEKGSRNKKVAIGHIDLESGKAVYKPEYLTRTNADNRSHEILQQELMEALNSVKDFGVSYFLLSIASKIGLSKVLKQSIPQHWQKILTLACYLVAYDKAVMYCDDWSSSNDGFDTDDMSSQRVSELLASISFKERQDFHRDWYKHIREQECLALDITSVSSYSQQITDCEWGYNRDHEDLPQINICMFFGESSRLPVYQTEYSGSLRDLSTLDSTIAEFTATVGAIEYSLVMDKGFYRERNVNMLLEREGCKFLLPVSFTSKFALKQIESESKDIDQLDHVIHTTGMPIRGVCKLRSWGKDGKKLYTHVYYDPEKALKDRDELYEFVTRLQELVMQSLDKKEDAPAIKKYLIVRKSETASGGLTVNIRKDAVDKTLKTSGWLVLLSNHISDSQEALDIYRIKDVVEKGFWKYKNNLGLDRLHVHTDERVQNKIFVSFIALILESHIHNIMDKKVLYNRWTFDRLLIVLAKLKVFTVNGTRILRPLTKEQRNIFEAFDIELPSTC